jgi:F-box interacting protein
VILCNPAIQEYKLLPSSPYLPNSDGPNSSIDYRFIQALGFGYDPNLNEYKLVDFGFTEPEYATTPDELNIYLPPKAAVYTLGTDSWREINTDSLETETTILWPEYFQMHFKEMCYWLGREQHNEIDVLDVDYEEFIRNVIIMFDTGDELFHDMMLPDSFYDPSKFNSVVRLLVWNQSIALVGMQRFAGNDDIRFGIWVMDEFGAWTKHTTFENINSLIGKSLAFLKSNEIIMSGEYDHLLSYNLDTKKLKYLPIQSTWTDSAIVVYVNSIVSVLGGNKLKSRDNSTPNV